MKHFFSFGGGNRNRTHIDGFGDRSPTVERYPPPNINTREEYSQYPLFHDYTL